MFSFLLNRCGKDLVSLYNSPAIQHFLNGIQAKTLQSDKDIYQPGALRKVSKVYIFFYRDLFH